MSFFGLNSKKAHLFLGGAAAGIALGLPKKNGWRVPAAAIAALEIGNALIQYRAAEPATNSLDVAAPVKVKEAVVDGIDMRWEEHGDTESGSILVIMVHGIPTNPRLWRYVIPKVERKTIKCLAWEMVGFGWSMEEGFGRDISVARQAEYLYAWLQHQGISRAVFVGHDLGGGVIQQLLTKHPKLCMGLVLTDCIAYDNWPVLPVKLAKKMDGTIEKLSPSMFKPVFLGGLLDLGHDNAMRRQESIALHWKPYSRAIGPKAFAHQVRNLYTTDTMELEGKLSRINAPARVIWGDADPLGTSSGEKLAEELDATFSIIKGGRHFTPEDHPAKIAAAINDVLNELG